MRKYIVIGLFSFYFLNCAIGQTNIKKKYKSFQDFYNSISKGHNLNFSCIELTDSSITKTILKDTIKTSTSYRFDKSQLKCVTATGLGEFLDCYYSYFVFNNNVIPLDSNQSICGLKFSDAAKLTLNGKAYILLSASSPGCNGTSCRIEYDYLFQIENDLLSYMNFYSWQSPSNIYCDLNNDGELDQITFMGDCSNKNKNIKDKFPKKDNFCIQALTLKNNKWIPMTDADNRPYFIYIEVNDFFQLDPFKILDSNWFTIPE